MKLRALTSIEHTLAWEGELSVKQFAISACNNFDSYKVLISISIRLSHSLILYIQYYFMHLLNILIL